MKQLNEVKAILEPGHIPQKMTASDPDGPSDDIGLDETTDVVLEARNSLITLKEILESGNKFNNTTPVAAVDTKVGPEDIANSENIRLASNSGLGIAEIVSSEELELLERKSQIFERNVENFSNYRRFSDLHGVSRKDNQSDVSQGYELSAEVNAILQPPNDKDILSLEFERKLDSYSTAETPQKSTFAGGSGTKLERKKNLASFLSANLESNKLVKSKTSMDKKNPVSEVTCSESVLASKSFASIDEAVHDVSIDETLVDFFADDTAKRRKKENEATALHAFPVEEEHVVRVQRHAAEESELTAFTEEHGSGLTRSLSTMSEHSKQVRFYANVTVIDDRSTSPLHSLDKAVTLHSSLEKLCSDESSNNSIESDWDSSGSATFSTAASDLERSGMEENLFDRPTTLKDRIRAYQRATNELHKEVEMFKRLTSPLSPVRQEAAREFQISTSRAIPPVPTNFSETLPTAKGDADSDNTSSSKEPSPVVVEESHSVRELLMAWEKVQTPTQSPAKRRQTLHVAQPGISARVTGTVYQQLTSIVHSQRTVEKHDKITSLATACSLSQGDPQPNKEPFIGDETTHSFCTDDKSDQDSSKHAKDFCTFAKSYDFSKTVSGSNYKTKNFALPGFEAISQEQKHSLPPLTTSPDSRASQNTGENTSPTISTIDQLQDEAQERADYSELHEFEQLEEQVCNEGLFAASRDQLITENKKIIEAGNEPNDSDSVRTNTLDKSNAEFPSVLSHTSQNQSENRDWDIIDEGRPSMYVVPGLIVSECSEKRLPDLAVEEKTAQPRYSDANATQKIYHVQEEVTGLLQPAISEVGFKEETILPGDDDDHCDAAFKNQPVSLVDSQQESLGAIGTGVDPVNIESAGYEQEFYDNDNGMIAGRPRVLSDISEQSEVSALNYEARQSNSLEVSPQSDIIFQSIISSVPEHSNRNLTTKPICPDPDTAQDLEAHKVNLEASKTAQTVLSTASQDVRSKDKTQSISATVQYRLSNAAADDSHKGRIGTTDFCPNFSLNAQDEDSIDDYVKTLHFVQDNPSGAENLENEDNSLASSEIVQDIFIDPQGLDPENVNLRPSKCAQNILFKAQDLIHENETEIKLVIAEDCSSATHDVESDNNSLEISPSDDANDENLRTLQVAQEFPPKTQNLNSEECYSEIVQNVLSAIQDLNFDDGTRKTSAPRQESPSVTQVVESADVNFVKSVKEDFSTTDLGLFIHDEDKPKTSEIVKNASPNSQDLNPENKDHSNSEIAQGNLFEAQNVDFNDNEAQPLVLADSPTVQDLNLEKGDFRTLEIARDASPNVQRLDYGDKNRNTSEVAPDYSFETQGRESLFGNVKTSPVNQAFNVQDKDSDKDQPKTSHVAENPSDVQDINFDKGNFRTSEVARKVSDSALDLHFEYRNQKIAQDFPSEAQVQKQFNSNNLVTAPTDRVCLSDSIDLHSDNSKQLSSSLVCRDFLSSSQDRSDGEGIVKTSQILQDIVNDVQKNDEFSTQHDLRPGDGILETSEIDPDILSNVQKSVENSPWHCQGLNDGILKTYEINQDILTDVQQDVVGLDDCILKASESTQNVLSDVRENNEFSPKQDLGLDDGIQKPLKINQGVFTDAHENVEFSPQHDVGTDDDIHKTSEITQNVLSDVQQDLGPDDGILKFSEIKLSVLSDTQKNAEFSLPHNLGPDDGILKTSEISEDVFSNVHENVEFSPRQDLGPRDGILETSEIDLSTLSGAQEDVALCPLQDVGPADGILKTSEFKRVVLFDVQKNVEFSSQHDLGPDDDLLKSSEISQGVFTNVQENVEFDPQQDASTDVGILKPPEIKQDTLFDVGENVEFSPQHYLGSDDLILKTSEMVLDVPADVRQDLGPENDILKMSDTNRNVVSDIHENVAFSSQQGIGPDCGILKTSEIDQEVLSEVHKNVEFFPQQDLCPDNGIQKTLQISQDVLSDQESVEFSPQKDVEKVEEILMISEATLYVPSNVRKKAEFSVEQDLGPDGGIQKTSENTQNILSVVHEKDEFCPQQDVGIDDGILKTFEGTQYFLSNIQEDVEFSPPEDLSLGGNIPMTPEIDRNVLTDLQPNPESSSEKDGSIFFVLQSLTRKKSNLSLVGHGSDFTQDFASNEGRRDIHADFDESIEEAVQIVLENIQVTLTHDPQLNGCDETSQMINVSRENDSLSLTTVPKLGEVAESLMATQSDLILNVDVIPQESEVISGSVGRVVILKDDEDSCTYDFSSQLKDISNINESHQMVSEASGKSFSLKDQIKQSITDSVSSLGLTQGKSRGQADISHSLVASQSSFNASESNSQVFTEKHAPKEGELVDSHVQKSTQFTLDFYNESLSTVTISPYEKTCRNVKSDLADSAHSLHAQLIKGDKQDQVFHPRDFAFPGSVVDSSHPSYTEATCAGKNIVNVCTTFDAGSVDDELFDLTKIKQGLDQSNITGSRSHSDSKELVEKYGNPNSLVIEDCEKSIRADQELMTEELQSDTVNTTVAESCVTGARPLFESPLLPEVAATFTAHTSTTDRAILSVLNTEKDENYLTSSLENTEDRKDVFKSITEQSNENKLLPWKSVEIIDGSEKKGASGSQVHHHTSDKSDTGKIAAVIEPSDSVISQDSCYLKNRDNSVPELASDDSVKSNFGSDVDRSCDHLNEERDEFEDSLEQPERDQQLTGCNKVPDDDQISKDLLHHAPPSFDDGLSRKEILTESIAHLERTTLSFDSVCSDIEEHVLDFTSSNSDYPQANNAFISEASDDASLEDESYSSQTKTDDLTSAMLEVRVGLLSNKIVSEIFSQVLKRPTSSSSCEGNSIQSVKIKVDRPTVEEGVSKFANQEESCKKLLTDTLPIVDRETDHEVLYKTDFAEQRCQEAAVYATADTRTEVRDACMLSLPDDIKEPWQENFGEHLSGAQGMDSKTSSSFGNISCSASVDTEKADGVDKNIFESAASDVYNTSLEVKDKPSDDFSCSSTGISTIDSHTNVKVSEAEDLTLVNTDWDKSYSDLVLGSGRDYTDHNLDLSCGSEPVEFVMQRKHHGQTVDMSNTSQAETSLADELAAVMQHEHLSDEQNKDLSLFDSENIAFVSTSDEYSYDQAPRATIVTTSESSMLYDQTDYGLREQVNVQSTDKPDLFADVHFSENCKAHDKVVTELIWQEAVIKSGALDFQRDLDRIFEEDSLTESKQIFGNSPPHTESEITRVSFGGFGGVETANHNLDDTDDNETKPKDLLGGDGDVNQSLSSNIDNASCSLQSSFSSSREYTKTDNAKVLNEQLHHIDCTTPEINLVNQYDLLAIDSTNFQDASISPDVVIITPNETKCFAFDKLKNSEKAADLESSSDSSECGNAYGSLISSDLIMSQSTEPLCATDGLSARRESNDEMFGFPEIYSSEFVLEKPGSEMSRSVSGLEFSNFAQERAAVSSDQPRNTSPKTDRCIDVRSSQTPTPCVYTEHFKVVSVEMSNLSDSEILYSNNATYDIAVTSSIYNPTYAGCSTADHGVLNRPKAPSPPRKSYSSDEEVREDVSKCAEQQEAHLSIEECCGVLSTPKSSDLVGEVSADDEFSFKLYPGHETQFPACPAAIHQLSSNDFFTSDELRLSTVPADTYSTGHSCEFERGGDSLVDSQTSTDTTQFEVREVTNAAENYFSLGSESSLSVFQQNPTHVKELRSDASPSFQKKGLVFSHPDISGSRDENEQILLEAVVSPTESLQAQLPITPGLDVQTVSSTGYMEMMSIKLQDNDSNRLIQNFEILGNKATESDIGSKPDMNSELLPDLSAPYSSGGTFSDITSAHDDHSDIHQHLKSFSENLCEDYGKISSEDESHAHDQLARNKKLMESRSSRIPIAKSGVKGSSLSKSYKESRTPRTIESRLSQSLPTRSRQQRLQRDKLKALEFCSRTLESDTLSKLPVRRTSLPRVKKKYRKGRRSDLAHVTSPGSSSTISVSSSSSNVSIKLRKSGSSSPIQESMFRNEPFTNKMLNSEKYIALKEGVFTYKTSPALEKEEWQMHKKVTSEIESYSRRTVSSPTHEHVEPGPSAKPTCGHVSYSNQMSKENPFLGESPRLDFTFDKSSGFEFHQDSSFSVIFTTATNSVCSTNGGSHSKSHAKVAVGKLESEAVNDRQNSERNLIHRAAIGINGEQDTPHSNLDLEEVDFSQTQQPRIFSTVSLDGVNIVQQTQLFENAYTVSDDSLNIGTQIQEVETVSLFSADSLNVAQQIPEGENISTVSTDSLNVNEKNVSTVIDDSLNIGTQIQEVETVSLFSADSLNVAQQIPEGENVSTVSTDSLNVNEKNVSTVSDDSLNIGTQIQEVETVSLFSADSLNVAQQIPEGENISTVSTDSLNVNEKNVSTVIDDSLNIATQIQEVETVSLFSADTLNVAQQIPEGENVSTVSTDSLNVNEKNVSTVIDSLNIGKQIQEVETVSLFSADSLNVAQQIPEGENVSTVSTDSLNVNVRSVSTVIDSSNVAQQMQQFETAFTVIDDSLNIGKQTNGDENASSFSADTLNVVQQIPEGENVSTVSTDSLNVNVKSVSTVFIDSSNVAQQIQQFENISTIFADGLDVVQQIQEVKNVSTVTVDSLGVAQHIQDIGNVSAISAANLSVAQHIQDNENVSTASVDNLNVAQSLQQLQSESMDSADSFNVAQQMQEVENIHVSFQSVGENVSFPVNVQQACRAQPMGTRTIITLIDEDSSNDCSSVLSSDSLDYSCSSVIREVEAEAARAISITPDSFDAQSSSTPTELPYFQQSVDSRAAEMTTDQSTYLNLPSDFTVDISYDTLAFTDDNIATCQDAGSTCAKDTVVVQYANTSSALVTEDCEFSENQILSEEKRSASNTSSYYLCSCGDVFTV